MASAVPSRYLTLVLHRVQYSCPLFKIPLQREIKANDIQHQKKLKIMKRDNNIKQMALDFEHPENNYLTAEQIHEREEAEKRRIDEAFRKGVYVVSLLVILSNFIFI